MLRSDLLPKNNLTQVYFFQKLNNSDSILETILFGASARDHYNKCICHKKTIESDLILLYGIFTVLEFDCKCKLI